MSYLIQSKFEVCPSGDPSKISVYKNDRKCVVCGRKLNSYNPNNHCLSGCISKMFYINEKDFYEYRFKEYKKKLSNKSKKRLNNNKYPGTKKLYDGRWKVQTTHNGVIIYIQHFKTQIEAYKALIKYKKTGKVDDGIILKEFYY